MEWLFRPKVQLGLFVNLIFVVFTLFYSSVGERTHARWRSAVLDDLPQIPYAPLPPPAAPSRATVIESVGQLSVSLSNDLTLVKKPDRMLLFSPSFSTRARPAEPPPTVTLRFIIFSEKEACPGACMLVINADGTHVWESAASGTFSTGWTREKIPSTSTTLDDGQVAKTLAAETLITQVPYVTFLDIISAKRVVLSLGPDKVELTHDQIEALRDMHRRVAPPPVEEQHEPKIIKTF